MGQEKAVHVQSNTLDSGVTVQVICGFMLAFIYP
jgi:hypothetical protein